MQEIEVKYRAGDVAALEKALAARGVLLSLPVLQDDQAFAPASWSYGDSKVGIAFARLRTQDGVHLFTVKQPVDNEMACLEHETTVADREEMARALQLMGWRPTVRIVKRRRTGRLGEIGICVDEVEHAGCFVELERVVRPQESGEAVQAELDEWARSLGEEVGLERTSDTYDSLVRAALSHA
ncbi:class IV adenylate cyclase [Thermomonospora cellulosilytica]|uniref:Adenylate cyclase class 2 n=1 Tax=Thermomonospora cellulosilytica TaxID=1411118 RepID=A0A7W3N1Q0_9ACTN|nr:CYTH domain-containing protein [Thermomonospora cellulosilytica]MBA9005933.1 adenylate cyclase class 2 [Thermomonospora cellulosilytica]